MINCSHQNLIEFCLKKEIPHYPKLEIKIFGNNFGYYNSFNEKSLNSWIDKRLTLDPIKSK